MLGFLKVIFFYTVGGKVEGVVLQRGIILDKEVTMSISFRVS